MAAAIKVYENTPEENYVIGITLVGEAEKLGSNIDPTIAKAYIQKMGQDPSTLDSITSASSPGKFYRLKSNLIVLFDSKDFPDKPRQ